MGRKVYDMTELVDLFRAQEGEVYQLIGKVGQGKTYLGTSLALEFLKEGKVVYTSWELILPEYFDERQSAGHLFWRLLFNKKRFYKFDFRENWKYIDIERPDLIEFLDGLTDCVVMLDEGQDVFDARGGMDRPARKVITRTRHMGKTLYIISQRAQAVDVTARANVTFFLKCVKTRAWFWPFKWYFKVYQTEEMDDQNYPIWEERMPNGKLWRAALVRKEFARDEVYDTYNSWYLRQGKPKSQEVRFEAYDLTFSEKLEALMTLMFSKERVNKPDLVPSPHLKRLSTGQAGGVDNSVVELEHGQDQDKVEASEERNVVAHTKSQVWPSQGKMDDKRSRDILRQEAEVK